MYIDAMPAESDDVRELVLTSTLACSRHELGECPFQSPQYSVSMSSIPINESKTKCKVSPVHEAG